MKSNTYKIILILFSLQFIGCDMDDCDGPDGWGEHCSNVTPNCNGSVCNQSDINIIYTMIELSKDINDGMDCDSSGVIEPKEFGNQVWVGDRLHELRFSGDYNDEIEPQCKNVYVYHVDQLVLPDNFGELDSLEKLTIGGGTNFMSIPVSFGELNNLREFYVYSNPIISLTDSIVNLITLNTLTIRGTGLTSIPDSIGRLNNLNSLILDNNQLTSIPESICNLPTNCYISVNNNKICDEKYHYDCIDNWGEQNCDD